MEELSPLVFARGRMLRHFLESAKSQSRLKPAFILFTGSLIWGGLLLVFYEGFSFMKENFPEIAPTLARYLFSLFYMSLMVMLAFSTGIILFASLFRSEETRFLLSSPMHAGTIFSYKFLESLTFSSWAFAFLAGPMILGYGLVAKAGLGFYVISVLLFPPYVLVAGAAGAIAVLVLTAYFPRRRRALIVLLVVAGAILVTVPGLRLLSWWRLIDTAPEIWFQGVLNRLSFCRSPWLPSYWMTEGMLWASEGEQGKALFYAFQLGANALFLFAVAHFVATKKYMGSWSAAQGGSGARRYRSRGALDVVVEKSFIFLPPKLRVLLVKDIKNFRRDPVQWSQFLIFFGLLAIYILNLRNLSYNVQSAAWRNAVAFLNFAATSLTLATFTSRFMFPLLSLEGRQLWMLGLLPLRREGIVLGKFVFALTGALLISEALILTSDLMLAMPGRVVLLHAIVLVLICVGLSGSAIGLGAAFPSPRENDPSKIVSGFGGTLNLVLSLCYIVVTVGMLAAVTFLAVVRQPEDPLPPMLWLVGLLAAVAGVTAVMAAVPMVVGMRAFRRMEF